MAHTTSSNNSKNSPFLHIIDLITRLFTRFRSSSVLWVTLILSAWNCSAALGYSTRISDQALVNVFYGKNVFIEMDKKQGQEGWDTARWQFNKDGNITGYLFSSNLLSLKSPQNDIDNGIWEIKDNNLCIQWAAWEDGEEHCYSIFLNDDLYIAKSDSGSFLAGEFAPQY
jgi:hypothetical protein